MSTAERTAVVAAVAPTEARRIWASILEFHRIILVTITIVVGTVIAAAIPSSQDRSPAPERIGTREPSGSTAPVATARSAGVDGVVTRGADGTPVATTTTQGR